MQYFSNTHVKFLSLAIPKAGCYISQPWKKKNPGKAAGYCQNVCCYPLRSKTSAYREYSEILRNHISLVKTNKNIH